MDNRTAHYAGSSQQPSRSILKPSRSSHGRQRARSPPPSSTSPPLPSRRTVQIVDAPEMQLTRSVAAIPSHGPIPEMTITFPAVQSTEQLEQLISDFAKQVKLRRRHQESNLAHDHRILSHPTPSAGRPTHAPDEYPEFREILMGPWQPGEHYGPVYEPHHAMKLGPLRVNPLIGCPPQVHWDVTKPPETATMVLDGRVIAYDEFRLQPATSPRITHVMSISRIMPWEWRLSSWYRQGVTIGDALGDVAVSLGVHMSEKDLNTLDEERRNAAIRTYQARCPDGGRGPQIFDILADSTLFGGWVHDQEYEKERNCRNNWEMNIVISYLPNTSAPG